jgi:hypothetical protein
MGSRQIVLVSTAGISVHNAGIFWREAKTKRLFSQCNYIWGSVEQRCTKMLAAQDLQSGLLLFSGSLLKI